MIYVARDCIMDKIIHLGEPRVEVSKICHCPRELWSPNRTSDTQAVQRRTHNGVKKLTNKYQNK